MTRKLYYEDAYCRRFTARVLRCARVGDLWETVLDQTAFYPEGGGQDGDRGRLGETEVVDTQEREGEIVHLCREPVPAGGAVEGEIDWARRFDLMQQHSGEHIVSGLIHRRLGWDNVGFHMGGSVTAIDFNGPITAEDCAAVERAANEKLWEDVPVEISWPGPEALAELDYRSKKELSGAVRIVSIPGADVCACCGTHVSRTGEIGLIKLLSCQKLRQGVRLELVCGARAYEWVSSAVGQNRLVSQLLSAKPMQTGAAAQRLLEDYEAVKYRLVGCENRLFEALADAGDGLLFAADLSPDGLRRLCDTALRRRGGVWAAFSGSDGGGYRYALGSAQGEVRELARALNAALDGRGGGRAGFAQGSVTASRAQIEAFFASARQDGGFAPPLPRKER